MRKVIALGLGFALIVAIAFVLQPRTSLKDAASASLVDVYAVAVLNEDVFLRKPGSSSFTRITENTEVRAGTEIKTSTRGRAHILHPDGTIVTIDGDSHIVIQRIIPANPSRLSHMASSVWSKIQNIIGTQEYFEVGTDAASLRDLDFALEYRKQTLQASPTQVAAIIPVATPTATPAITLSPTTTATPTPSIITTPTPTPTPQVIERTITQIDQDATPSKRRNKKSRDNDDD